MEVRVSLASGYDRGIFAAPGGSSATGRGTIRNDEWQISFGEGSDGHENHADDGNRPVRFKVVLYPPALVPVTVSYAPVAEGDGPGHTWR